MSSELNRAIYARLSGTEVLTGDALSAQQSLAAVLATDPETSKPAIRFANKGNGALYPEITYRPAAGSFDSRFGHGMRVGNIIYAFEIWEQSQSAFMLTDIEQYIARLFEERLEAPKLVLASGYAFWMEQQVPMTPIYDDAKHAWLGVLLYRVVEAQFGSR